MHTVNDAGNTLSGAIKSLFAASASPIALLIVPLAAVIHAAGYIVIFAAQLIVQGAVLLIRAICGSLISFVLLAAMCAVASALFSMIMPFVVFGIIGFGCIFLKYFIPGTTFSYMARSAGLLPELKEGEEDRYASSCMKAFFLGNVIYIFHRLVIRAVLESAILLESTSPALIAAVSLLIVVPLGLMFYICTARTLKKYQRRD